MHFHVSAATGKQNGGRNNDKSASLNKFTKNHSTKIIGSTSKNRNTKYQKEISIKHQFQQNKRYIAATNRINSVVWSSMYEHELTIQYMVLMCKWLQNNWQMSFNAPYILPNSYFIKININWTYKHINKNEWINNNTDVFRVC